MMKITLDIPDGTVCAFVNRVIKETGYMTMAVDCLSSEDLRDGNTIKLPRDGGAEDGND